MKVPSKEDDRRIHDTDLFLLFKEDIQYLHEIVLLREKQIIIIERVLYEHFRADQICVITKDSRSLPEDIITDDEPFLQRFQSFRVLQSTGMQSITVVE